MALYTLNTPPVLEDPTMIIGLAGWGDAAGVASDTAEWLADGGQPIVTFDPDALFEYGSSRPVLRYAPSEAPGLSWPRMEIVHVKPSGRDVLVLVGTEPNLAWSGISDALVNIVTHFGVSRVVSLGSVPMPIRHGEETNVFCAASDQQLLLDGDELLMEEITVPASAASVFRAVIEENGIPAIGYWAQVPPYVRGPYHSGIAALIERVARQIDVVLDTSGLTDRIADQTQRLDTILSESSALSEFVEGLGDDLPNPPLRTAYLPTADELADEVLKYLEDPDG